MATPLNKTSRTATLNAVMAATTIPAKRKELCAAASTIARYTLIQYLPEQFNELVVATHRELRGAWFSSTSSLYCNRDSSPRGIFDEISYIPFDDPVYTPIDTSFTYHGDFQRILKFALVEVTAEAVALLATERKLQYELTMYLLAHRTVESAVKSMPELKPYFPEVVVQSYPLVAPIYVAALLAQAGIIKESVII